MLNAFTVSEGPSVGSCQDKQVCQFGIDDWDVEVVICRVIIDDVLEGRNRKFSGSGVKPVTFLNNTGQSSSTIKFPDCQILLV